MGFVNNEWGCFLAELQLPDVPQVKKANSQQHFSIKLGTFDRDWIKSCGVLEGYANADSDEMCFDFSEEKFGYIISRLTYNKDLKLN